MTAQGDLTGAKVQHQKYLEIAEKLTKQDPGNSVWQHNLAEAYKAFGILLKKQGDFSGARKNFQASLANCNRFDPAPRRESDVGSGSRFG
jgi:tetratricopeptide (TPR) repeat protein